MAERNSAYPIRHVEPRISTEMQILAMDAEGPANGSVDAELAAADADKAEISVLVGPAFATRLNGDAKLFHRPGRVEINLPNGGLLTQSSVAAREGKGRLSVIGMDKSKASEASVATQVPGVGYEGNVK